MSHTVTLSWWEHFQAAVVGAMRVTESARRGNAKHIELRGAPLDGKREQHDIDSAGAEMAVAKLLNHYWHAAVNAFGTDRLPDVGKRIEVRSTNRHHSLLVRDRDADDRYYVLVRGSIPTYEVIGWMRGAEAKQDRWKQDPNEDGPCYLVPAEELHSFKLGSQPL